MEKYDDLFLNEQKAISMDFDVTLDEKETIFYRNMLDDMTPKSCLKKNKKKKIYFDNKLSTEYYDDYKNIKTKEFVTTKTLPKLFENLKNGKNLDISQSKTKKKSLKIRYSTGGTKKKIKNKLTSCEKLYIKNSLKINNVTKDHQKKKNKKISFRNSRINKYDFKNNITKSSKKKEKNIQKKDVWKYVENLSEINLHKFISNLSECNLKRL